MNVAEALAREIGRVTELRQTYADLPKKLDEATRQNGSRYKVSVNMAPVLFLMDNAIEAAKRASGSKDALEQMAALKELQSFKE